MCSKPSSLFSFYALSSGGKLTNKKLAWGVPPYLSGIVCAFHPAAPGSRPKHTIYAFINLNFWIASCGKDENKKKEARIGPLKNCQEQIRSDLNKMSVNASLWNFSRRHGLLVAKFKNSSSRKFRFESLFKLSFAKFKGKCPPVCVYLWHSHSLYLSLRWESTSFHSISLSLSFSHKRLHFR